MKFSLSRQRLIAVQYADGMIRAGMLEKRRKTVQFESLCEQEVSLRSLSTEGSAWLPKESSQILVDQMVARNIQRGSPCVLLIEPEKVFSAVVTVPTLQEKMPQLIRTETEKFVPEPFDSLTVRTVPLAKQGDETQLGIAAMRTDVLQQRIVIATQAGLRPVVLATAPLVLGRFAKGIQETEVVLMIHLPFQPEAKGTLTLLYRGWILDEQVLPAGTPDDRIAALAKQMVQEQEGGRFPVTRVAYSGPVPNGKSLRDAFLIPAPTPSGGVGATLPFETIQLAATSAKPGCEDLIAACSLPIVRHAMNFAPDKLAVADKKGFVEGVVAVVAVAAAIGSFWWVFSFFRAPPPPEPVRTPPVASTGSVAKSSSSAPADTCRTAINAFIGLNADVPPDLASIQKVQARCATDKQVLLPIALCGTFPTQFSDVNPCGLPGHSAEQLLRRSVLTLPADRMFHPSRPVQRSEALKLLLQACPAVQPGSSSVPSPSGDMPFTDVLPSDWFAPFVQQALARGVVTAGGANLFRPADGITRAEFTKMLAVTCSVASGTEGTPYTDVSSSDWFAPYAAIARQFKLFVTTLDPSVAEPDMFEPSRQLSREETAVALYRYLSTMQNGPVSGSGTIVR